MRASLKTIGLLAPLFCLVALVSQASAQKIRVLAYYTPAAAAYLGSGLRQYIRDYGIDLSNTLYLASASSGQSMPSLELAGIKSVHYAESFFYPNKALDSMRTNNAAFALLNETRDLYAADIVMLVGNGWFNPGLAEGIGVAADTAFVTVNQGAMISLYMTAHEIGHLIGCDHEPASATPVPHPFAYGYGHLGTLSTWGDAMSYSTNRRPWFSNPNLNYLGEPRGTALVSNCTRVHSEESGTAEAFRGPLSSAVFFSDTIGAQEYADVMGAVVSTSGSVVLEAGSQSLIRASSRIEINSGFRSSGSVIMRVGAGALAKSRSRGESIPPASIKPIDAFSVQVVPKNSSWLLKYALPQPARLSVTLLSPDGSVLQMQKLGYRGAGSSEEVMNLRPVAEGMYLLRVTAEDRSVTRKVYWRGR